jgi:hypothetical protein
MASTRFIDHFGRTRRLRPDRRLMPSRLKLAPVSPIAKAACAIPPRGAARAATRRQWTRCPRASRRDDPSRTGVAPRPHRTCEGR